MDEAPTASLTAALDHATKLLPRAPALADRQAREILAVVPDDPRALLILGMSRLRMGDAVGARDVLAPLARAQPRSARTRHALAAALSALGETAEAITALREAVLIRRDFPDAWRALGDLLTLQGDDEGARAAYAQHIRASVHDPELLAAADALCDGRLAVAERLLRDRLKVHPTDAAAMRMLAETGTRLGRNADAENLLVRCLELAPDFDGARYNLAIVLFRQQKGGAAIGHLERLLAQDPREPGYRNLMAACLGLVGEYDRAIGIYAELLAEQPRQPQIWLSYGHALRTAGRRDQAVAAYNRCIALAPAIGDAYWSLANLKTVPFTDDERANMGRLLERPDLGGEDRFHLHFALGKALEDAGDAAAAFARYAMGAELRRKDIHYDADQTSDFTRRSKALFSADFFAARRASGSPDPAPIFVVGLPRSGSTLIEQILASHSAVEGTIELPDIISIASALGRRHGPSDSALYPEALGALSAATLRATGEDYLERTRIHRKQGRPQFIDKMPGNFQHIGLIHLILPNARIIDARRHPMAAGFSAFKQHFARGQTFSYDLDDIGRYFRDYLELMAHFDAVLPGRVHRVIYEDMIEDTEGRVRALLDHCGLEFEESCLRFHENPRAVRTASSEQVRRPIFRDGLDQWRRFAPWLGPLEAALGPALENWRSVGPAA